MPHTVDAESIEDTKERQGLPIYGVGKMCCSDKDCTEELYEVAIEQGFMEMLYRLKRDYEENKEQSELAVKYRECQKEPEDHSGRILELRELLQKLEQECKRLKKKQMEAQKKMGRAGTGSPAGEFTGIHSRWEHSDGRYYGRDGSTACGWCLHTRGRKCRGYVQ